MFELLLNVGNSGQQFFPDSGPGNKILRAGNKDIGYFGTLTSTELFSGWEVSSALGFTAGLVNKESDNTWMKFIYYGKFLFVCKEFTRYNLSWNDVYKAGAMYGVKGNGPYPVAGFAKDQWTVMVKEEAGVAIPWKLVPRTIRGANVDPYVGVDYTAFGLAEGNEHNDLIYRLLAVNANGRPNTGIFEKWPGTDLGTSAPTGQGFIQETSASNTANTMVRGPTGVTTSAPKATVRASTDSWRPVLELVGPDNVFNPYRLYQEYTGNQGPLSIAGQFVNVVYNPTQLQSDDGGAAKMINITAVTFVDVAHRPRDLTIVNPLVPVSMTFTRT